MGGDLNADLEDPEGTPRSEAIADKHAADGLLDMGLHTKDMFTWKMQRDGRVVQSWMDYILGTDRILFQNVAVWD